MPIRRLGSFLPGTDLGGAGAHWNGMTWRWLPSDHKLRSHLTERYGKNAIPEEMTIEDLPVSYDELEPYYDKFEKLCGVSGKAGNLRGKIIDGGNVFEGPRQNEYPNPPLARSMAGTIMDEASRSLGYHPFQAPSSNASETYTNFEGMTLGACEYCGHCERFGCEANAKASPNVCILPALLADPKFELRTNAQVKELVYDKAARKVTAVRYIDTRTGEEYEQPAGIVILGAYVFNNVLLMLTAGIGEPYDYKTGQGAVGKNYCYQVSGNAVTVFFRRQGDQSVHGSRRPWRADRRLQRRQLRSCGPWLLRRSVDSGGADQWPADSDATGAARHAAVGSRLEDRRRRSGTTTPSPSAPRAAITPTARTSWISIRAIVMRSAGR